MIEPTIRQLQISMLLGVALMITVLALVAGAGVAVTVGASERISSRLLPAREANAALLRNMLDRETGVRVYLVQSKAGDLIGTPTPRPSSHNARSSCADWSRVKKTCCRWCGRRSGQPDAGRSNSPFRLSPGSAPQ